MGLFGFGKKNKPTNETTVSTTAEPATPYVAPERNEVFLDLSKPGLLNLNKNEFLNLSKTGVNLEDIRVAAGWDVNHFGQDYDLDLCAYLLDSDNNLIDTVYYYNKRAHGFQLDKDNLTGEGDGDDENIFVNFDEIKPRVTHVIFGVVIYSANSRKQSFKHVHNAFVRMVDQSVRPERELCRCGLSEDGGDNTAVQFAEIYRTDEGWNFAPIGTYSKDSIESLGRHISR